MTIPHSPLIIKTNIDIAWPIGIYSNKTVSVRIHSFTVIHKSHMMGEVG